MNRTKILPMIIMAILLISCTDSKKMSTVTIDEDIYAIGYFKDSVFNGEVKYYNSKSGKILYTYHYEKGVKNGPAIDYYENGKIAIKSFFENGKMNGTLEFFGEDGTKKSSEYYHYGLKVGSTILYKDGKVAKYVFHDLDRYKLLEIDYSVLAQKPLPESLKEYFFYNMIEIKDIAENRSLDLFLYTPDPPELNFKYSLVLVDSTFSKLGSIEESEAEAYWKTFSISNSQLKNVAIRLQFQDKIRGEVIMYKRIKQVNR